MEEGIGLKYMTPKEAAERWGISQRRVHTLCLEGRVLGVERHGWTWLIPETAEKPGDARVKSGRYIRTNTHATRASDETAAAAVPSEPEAEEHPFLIPAPLFCGKTVILWDGKYCAKP